MKFKRIGKSSVMLLTIISVSSLIMVNAQELKAVRDSITLQRQQKEQREQKTVEQKAQDQLRTRDQTNGGRQPPLRERTGERTNASGKQPNTAVGGKTGSQPGDASTGQAKKIQGARPDWSKAKGARPASIERPSGSRIPKGAGRPAGARGPGKR